MNMKRVLGLIGSLAEHAVPVIYTAVMLWILFTILFLGGLPTAEWVRKSFLLPNGILLAIAAAVIGMIIRTGVLNRFSARFRIMPASLILLAVQLFIAHRIYFETGWDAGENVMTDAWALAAGQGLSDTAAGYYSMYPNNVLILFLEKTIFRICRLAGLDSLQHALFVPVVIQCVISSFTGWLVYGILRSLHGEREEAKPAAVFGWFLFVLLTGLSPWLVVVYTDSLSLFIPVLMFWLYLQAKKRGGRSGILCRILIFFLAYWGYHLKATTAIAAIALLLAAILDVLHELAGSTGKALKKTVWGLGTNCILFLLVFAVSGILYGRMTAGLGFALDPEKEFTFRHYLMMGWNRESTGTFNFEDVDRSMFINDYEYRNDEDLTEAKRRIRQMLPWDVIPFQAAKTLVNFHDGTFSYGVEGNFYMVTFDSDSSLTRRLRNVFWDTGTGYAYLAVTEQGIWITVLALCLANGILQVKRRRKNGTASGLLAPIMIVGIFMFTELFEARARYLYIYAPVFIISASMGFGMLSEKGSFLRKKVR